MASSPLTAPPPATAELHPDDAFLKVVAEVQRVGQAVHAPRIIEHAARNRPHAQRSLRDLPPLPPEKRRSGIVVSAGPSVKRRRSIERIAASGYRGAIIAADGSYLSCLKAGLVPDYVLTLDPDATRIVRWFGDPEFARHAAADDYFARQDLDVGLRQAGLDGNARDIALVDRHSADTALVIASSAHATVVDRTRAAGFAAYWWNPIVDDPRAPDSLTRRLRDLNGLPCMNTGGTVGTASWVFAASILRLPRIGLVGFDYGYYADNPIEKTQTYHELVTHTGEVAAARACFPEITDPVSGETYYTDPTYYWYRKNLLELLALAPNGVATTNCTEGGTIFGDGIARSSLDAFLEGS